jgi:hypothetical protein
VARSSTLQTLESSVAGSTQNSSFGLKSTSGIGSNFDSSTGGLNWVNDSSATLSGLRQWWWVIPGWRAEAALTLGYSISRFQRELHSVKNRER